MTRFIEDHRSAFGVGPICRVLPIAPATYYARAAVMRDPYPLLAAIQKTLEGRQRGALIEMPKLRTASRLEAMAQRIRNLGIDLSDAGVLGTRAAEGPAEASLVARVGG